MTAAVSTPDGQVTCLGARANQYWAKYWAEHSWRSSWVCLCRSAELAAGGSQAGFYILGDGVLVVHDNDGKIGAFVNACRHRGHELVPQGGIVRRSTIWCPYHAWVYRLDGSLRSCPGFGDLAERDQAGMGLIPVRSHEWNGWLFVNLGGNATVFPEVSGEQQLPAVPALGELRITSCSVNTVPASWRSLISDFLRHHQLVSGRDETSLRICAQLGKNPAQIRYHGLLANLLLVGFSDHVISYRLEPFGPESTRVVREQLAPSATIRR